MTTSRDEIILKAFLSRCSPEKQSRLETFLPEAKRLRLNAVAPFTDIEAAGKFTSDSLLAIVHWSWFLPTLKTYSQAEQIAFLSALPSHAALNISKSLQIPYSLMPLTEIARSYIQNLLKRSLISYKEYLLPPEYLPASPLNELLRLSKKQLIHLVNLLSLHDLAAELRQIVETKILKKIYSCLTEEERKRLNELSSYKEHPALPRLSLDRWDGQEDSLRVLLHRRGLIRLSLVLSGQDPDLIWYIGHQFDIGRGTTLLTFCAKVAGLQQSESMIREIDELMRNYL
ncbi:MAG TPA: hypothetical protein DCE71_06625 [Parachlamydiales bacterium]|nr:hypothetical protein [Parachlamydiales bacterium]